jgi:MtN3 and saliva related transmembrane protein
MNSIEALGFISATLTTVSFLPQVWHTWRTRDVSGISLGMYTLFTVGVAGWLLYGLASGAWPVIIANAITLVFACVILALKIQLGRPALLTTHRRAPAARAAQSPNAPAASGVPGS